MSMCMGICYVILLLGKTSIFVITPFSPTVLGLLSLFPYLQRGRNYDVVGKTLLCLKNDFKPKTSLYI